jgi:hypothetical protein
MSQYGFLFPYGKGKDLLLPEDSLRLITPAKTSLPFSRLLRRRVGELLPLSQSTYSIVDGTANVGGDAIAFALLPEFRVTAVEKDEETCKALQHNLEQYSLGNRVKGVYCQNIFDFLATGQKGDVLYLDPPFGDEYSNAQVLQYMPSISNKTLTEIVCTSLANFRVIALKVPRNKFPLSIFRKEVALCHPQARVEFYNFSQGGKHKVDFVLVVQPDDMLLSNAQLHARRKHSPL